MTRQQMFDRVWQHFVVEKGPASGNVTRCYYRSENGAKCALGLLIPDEMYDPQMEGTPSQALLGGWPQVRELLEQGYDGSPDCFASSLWTFTRSLQFCHDTAVESCYDGGESFHTLVENQLRDFAVWQDLTIPS
jgi:hypothetical protein